MPTLAELSSGLPPQRRKRPEREDGHVEGVESDSTPMASAADASGPSKVLILTDMSAAEASRCASIQPKPRPNNRFDSINQRTWSFSAMRACGRSSRRPRILLRSAMDPHASSPATKGWLNTWPSSRRPANSGFPYRRCAIQIEVSARIKPSASSAADGSA